MSRSNCARSAYLRVDLCSGDLFKQAAQDDERGLCKALTSSGIQGSIVRSPILFVHLLGDAFEERRGQMPFARVGKHAKYD